MSQYIVSPEDVTVLATRLAIVDSAFHHALGLVTIGHGLVGALVIKDLEATPTTSRKDKSQGVQMPIKVAGVAGGAHGVENRGTG